MTILPKQVNAIKTITSKEIKQADFNFQAPFYFDLADNQTFFAERIVRILPQKRLLAFGVWQNKPAVAKLFFNGSDACHDVAKDLHGVQVLQKNNIPTPPLYCQGISKDKQIHALIFARIVEAKNLEEIWKTKTDVDAVFPVLQKSILELATQHVLGVLQQDLHLKNFLFTEKTIYTLDGAQVSVFPALLPKKISMDYLALFLAQLGVGFEQQQQALFLYYAKMRGWLLKKQDVHVLFSLIEKWNSKRWQNFSRKIFRESSDFACFNRKSWVGMYDRKLTIPALLQNLSNPNQLFEQPGAIVLKAGRSATVIKITLDQREFVVKRYNLKNIWHRLRRCLRSTRAKNAWLLGQKLTLFNGATAQPVAFVEKRCLGLRGHAYYIAEYVAGEHADVFFAQSQDEKIVARVISRLVILLKSIAKLGITHGDLKATNILINAYQQPFLIDFDGAVQHASLSSLHRAWQKEIERFLQNFHHQPNLKDKFAEELRNAKTAIP